MISHNVPALLFFCRSPSVRPPSNNEHFRVTYERTNRGSTVIADNNGGGGGRQTKNVTRQRKWEIDLSGGLGMEFRMMTRVRRGKEGSVTGDADFAESLTHSTAMMIRAKCSVVET